MLFKKFFCVFILSLFVFVNYFSVRAENLDIGNLPANSYTLIEANTGKILTEKNPDEKMSPASMTKIMTMLLLIEKIEAGDISLQDMVTASKHANSMGGSQIWLDTGEQMSVEDLLKAVAVNSANDAAVAIAEYVAGSEENFVGLMNDKANELGMVNSHFCNASGLDADGHFSTARDISILGKELLKHSMITKYTSIYMDSLKDGKIELVNTNKMVRFYEGCNGLKTGTTDNAGSCLCCTATRNNMTLIAVSMGSKTSKDRFNTCRALLDYGFSGWELIVPDLSSLNINSINVINGKKNCVDVKIESDVSSVLVPKNNSNKIETKLEMDNFVEAPVEHGRCIGNVKCLLEGKEVLSSKIVVDDNVEKVDFKFLMVEMLKDFFLSNKKFLH